MSGVGRALSPRGGGAGARKPSHQDEVTRSSSESALAEHHPRIAPRGSTRREPSRQHADERQQSSSGGECHGIPCSCARNASQIGFVQSPRSRIASRAGSRTGSDLSTRLLRMENSDSSGPSACRSRNRSGRSKLVMMQRWEG